MNEWKSYAETYHGGNDELVELYNANGSEYFLEFKFILLQLLPLKMSEKEIVHIETKYKDKYLTKKFGLNRN